MMYFEVLRHYAIFQELATVEECVFVPLLLARFSVENIATWRDVLASALLPMPSETYLQPFVAMAGSVREHPLIGDDILVGGFMYDVDNGRLTQID